MKYIKLSFYEKLHTENYLRLVNPDGLTVVEKEPMFPLIKGIYRISFISNYNTSHQYETGTYYIETNGNEINYMGNKITLDKGNIGKYYECKILEIE